MNYWLLKSEPTSYSIDHLQREHGKITSWDGVRNYQARNFMRDKMNKSDLAFFYHSNCKDPGIAGIVEIVRGAHPDLTALDPEDHHYDPKSTHDAPRWVMVEVKFKRKFKKIISLHTLRENPLLKDLLILRRGNRLSITPVDKKDWDTIIAMAT